MNTHFEETMSIKVEPDPVLRKKTTLVSREWIVTSDAKVFFKKLHERMHIADGIGIAAPQVGVSMRICIVSDSGKNFQLLINPEITWQSRETNVSLEGCLSVPHTFGDVKRPKSVHVKALDENGKVVKLKAKAMLSRVIQHEIDHLNGVLFIDKAVNIYTSTTENMQI